MKIAIVGGGAAGLITARLLSTKHEVVLFEKDEQLGGNAKSLEVSNGHVDLGVNLFHRDSYPNFFQLLAHLNLTCEPCNLTIQVGWNGIAGWTYDYNRQCIVAPRRPLRNRLLRFRLGATVRNLEVLLANNPNISFSEILHECRADMMQKQALRLLAMGVWTMRSDDIGDFPASFVLNQLHRLGLTSSGNKSGWVVLNNGVSSYIKKLRQDASYKVRHTTVQRVCRNSDAVHVWSNGQSYSFEHVVLALPGDQAWQLVEGGNSVEQRILPEFKSISHHILLDRFEASSPRTHQPSIRMFGREESGGDMVVESATTDLNLLTNGRQPIGYLLSHGQPTQFTQETVYSWLGYTPSFSPGAIRSSSLQDQVSGLDRISYCGACWGNGLHEAAVSSAIKVAKEFQIELAAIAQ